MKHFISLFATLAIAAASAVAVPAANDGNLNPNKTAIYSVVEEQAHFPGGQDALMKWIADSLRYPAVAMEQGIEGRVVVRFVVRTDGTTSNFEIVRGKHPELDKEALRVVKTLPAFIPGKMNGDPVNVWYYVPVTFKLPAAD